MNYQDLMEAIAARIAKLWPDRMLYRDFCPADHKRPSGFLYVTNAGYEDANLFLVQWTFEAELTLYAATDAYSAESTEELRADQLAVLGAFGGPAIKVGDRSVMLTVGAPSPGPGEAYVTFSASWMDGRPACTDPDIPPSDVPLMEHYELNISTKE